MKGYMDKRQKGGMISMGGKEMTEDGDDESQQMAMKGKGSYDEDFNPGKGKQMNHMRMYGTERGKTEELSLRIMSYNIWGAGMNEGKPINETVAAILAADPDIIGIQETRLETDPCTAENCPPGGVSVAD